MKKNQGLVLLSVFSLLSGIALGLVGCSKQSDYLVPRPVYTGEKVKDSSTNLIFDPSVDILFVVDDSGSMSDAQRNLAANVDKFVAEFSKNQLIGYHIGVITSSEEFLSYTGHGGGRLSGNPYFVERATPNGLTILKSNINVGTSGDSMEKFFTPVRKALEGPIEQTYNKGFLRPDAFLAVIFLTDTDDQSYMSAQDMRDFLVRLKGSPEKVLTYGVFKPVTNSICYDRGGELPPVKLEDFLRLMNGGKLTNELDICDSDFGTKLAAVGSELEQKIGKIMYLNQAPDPATIEVRFGKQILPNDIVKGWTYDPSRNALLFGPKVALKPEPPGTKLEVTFQPAFFN